jgi:hypothetical protein
MDGERDVNCTLVRDRGSGNRCPALQRRLYENDGILKVLVFLSLLHPLAQAAEVTLQSLRNGHNTTHILGRFYVPTTAPIERPVFARAQTGRPSLAVLVSTFPL